MLYKQDGVGHFFVNFLFNCRDRKKKKWFILDHIYLRGKHFSTMGKACWVRLAPTLVDQEAGRGECPSFLSFSFLWGLWWWGTCRWHLGGSFSHLSVLLDGTLPDTPKEPPPHIPVNRVNTTHTDTRNWQLSPPSRPLARHGFSPSVSVQKFKNCVFLDFEV